MPSEDSEEQETHQLNVALPDDLYREVKKASIDWNLKLRKGVRHLLSFGLYIVKNAGYGETWRIVEENEPLVYLLAARNDLSHRGFDVSELDTLIQKVESFLEPKNKEEKKE